MEMSSGFAFVEVASATAIKVTKAASKVSPSKMIKPLYANGRGSLKRLATWLCGPRIEPARAGSALAASQLLAASAASARPINGSDNRRR